MAGEQADIFGAQIRLGPVFRIGKHRTSDPFQIPAARWVVQVQHRLAALVKEQSLGRSIFLHGVVIIQVVLGQIGEQPQVKGQSRRPVLDQGVGGYLHYHIGTAIVQHLAQKGLELIALRGGAVGRQLLPPYHVPIGADQANLGPARPLQQFFDEAGGGGLAVGPGDRHQGHSVPRMSKPVGREKGQSQSGILCHQPGTRPIRSPLAQDGRGASLQSRVDVPVTIRLISGQSHEESAGLQGPAVIRNGIYFHLLVNVTPLEGDAVQQLAQFHVVTPQGWV